MKVRYINSYQCVFVASPSDRLPLIFVRQNAMAVMSYDGPSLPFDFKFTFENSFKSILIKSNLIDEMINQLRQQLKNKIQVKAEMNLVSDSNLKCNF